MEVGEKTAEKAKVIVICVDEDADIRSKANVNTPVIGEKAVKNAAVKLAIADPEDADTNAIFGAIKAYYEISEIYGKENCEIAIIAGDPRRGALANLRLEKELDTVLGKFKADKAVIVSDSIVDEGVLSVIQSRVPIFSINPVIVKHSKGLEETLLVFSRYIKSVLRDPYLSRWFVGVPGIILILLTIVSIIGYGAYAGYAILIFLGSLLLVKGFELDIKVVETVRAAKTDLIMGIIVVLFIVGGAYYGWMTALASYNKFGNLYLAIGEFITESGWIIAIGISIMLVGKFIEEYISQSLKYRVYLMELAYTWLIWLPVHYLALCLSHPELVLYFITSAVISIIGAIVSYSIFGRVET